MFETTYYTFVSLLLYFIILFFSQVLYSVLKRKKTSLEFLKIIRDLFKTVIFIGLLIYAHILNFLSLSVNFVSLFFFGLCTILFIFFHFAFDFKSIIYFLCMSSLLFLLREQSGAVLNSILLHMLMNLTIIYRK